MGIFQTGAQLDEIPFAAETASALPAPLLPGTFIRSSASSQPVAGYFSGAQPGVSTSTGQRFKVPFASGVGSSPGGGLSVARGWALGQHN